MARKPDIQYIHYQTDGTAARQPEFEFPLKRRALPKKKKRPVRVIGIDPVAIGGIVAALVLLVMMVTALGDLRAEEARYQQMQSYVQTLKAENLHLASTYESELDLEQIRANALAVGMIPAEEAEHITIQVTPPVTEAVEETATLWETICTFFEGLFA